MTVDDSENQKTVEIVYAHVRADPDDPESLEPRTKEVSAEWYEVRQRAHTALQRVSDEWIRKPGVRSVGLGADDGPVIDVTVLRQGENTPTFPETVDGVPVRIQFIDSDEGQLL